MKRLLFADGEYLFVDPESKLSKYAPKNWRSSHTYVSIPSPALRNRNNRARGTWRGARIGRWRAKAIELAQPRGVSA